MIIPELEARSPKDEFGLLNQVKVVVQAFGPQLGFSHYIYWVIGKVGRARVLVVLDMVD